MNPVFTRSSGLLMHITSLPGHWDTGDFGKEAYQFADFLYHSKQTLWQILPLAVPDATGSPYASISAFAGNPCLISPELLAEDGLISDAEFASVLAKGSDLVTQKKELIRIAAGHALESESTMSAYAEFLEKNRYWLTDFARFFVLKDLYDDAVWTEFPAEYRHRIPEALEQLDAGHKEAIYFLNFEQFAFSRQWQRLRDYAHARHIGIVGDLPIFVSHDSADVWSHQELFKLDEKGYPLVVAGVPPDVFSKTGQHWGNPHYRWDIMKVSGYSWWIHRLEHLLEQVDFIRLDHFRGFESVWEIPGDAKTAENGQWVHSAGPDFFRYLKEHLGTLPIIAEDLGIITEEVRRLRDDFEFPGMKILQFAFDSEHNPFLPDNYSTPHCIAYTGTHDNNTTRGWFRQDASEYESGRCRSILGCTEENVAEKMHRYGMESKAVWMIAPVQDILNLDEKARMNYPGTLEGNWRWRLESVDFGEECIRRLSQLTRETDRI